MEVLLTVCVCEVELRRSSVFSQLAQLISRLLVSGLSHHTRCVTAGIVCVVAGCPGLRLALQAALLWLMIVREQGTSMQ